MKIERGKGGRRAVAERGADFPFETLLGADPEHGLALELAEDHPASPWAEEALNNLASAYIRQDEDDDADRILRLMLSNAPRGRYAERAATKIGWRAYRAGNMREAAETFERAAAAFPRADNRPAWLYWSARARDQMNESTVAIERYAIAAEGRP